METNRYPLQRKWVIWEMWNQSRENSEISLKNMQEIGEFQGLHEFWQHWNYLPHADPKMLFEDPEHKVKIIIESINQSIDAIGLFEDKVKPVLEDSFNKNGSNFSFSVNLSDFNKLKTFWDTLVFSLIGETLPYSEDIVGCRVVDRKSYYKFEIWCKFDGNSPRITTKTGQIRDALKEIIGIYEVTLTNHS